MKTIFLRGFRRHLLAALVVLLAMGPVWAAPDKYTGSVWAPLDQKKALEAAAAITPEKDANCDEATVEEKITEVYHDDGTAEEQDEAYLKVLTEKGKRDRRTLALSFMLPYSKAEVVKLEVIKPDGKSVSVDVAANSKESIDTSQMDENIYDPNSKILEVNIPDLDAGDVLHWITRQTTLRPVMPGEFADENVFEGSGLLRHVVYEIHAPADKPLNKVVLRDAVPGTVQATTTPGPDKTLVYKWEVNNVPRMFPEPSMPPDENVLQRVLVSTTPDWHQVSKWYWNLSKPHLEATSPELKKKVEELTAGAKTDMDKIKALFYYVSQKVRYMGLTPEKDRPGYEPHDVCLTFSKKYGVCRDKAALLVAMLRTAGLNAYPVLVSVGSKKDKDVPDAAFNHAIVGVELTKGDYVLMDPTDEHTRELQPWYDGDQSYLVARPEGEDIRVSSVQSPDENMMTIRTTGTLSATGELVATSELSFKGQNDDIYRNAFSHMKPDDLSRFFEKTLKRAMPGARLKSLKVTPENMMDISTGLHAVVEFSVDGMIATGSGKAVVSVPWIGDGVGLVNFLLRGMGLDKRKYPLQTEVACGLDEDISLKLGAGFAGADSLPTSTPIDDSCIGYHQNFSVKDGTLDCSRRLELKVVEFSPEQYLNLKQVLKTMAYDARKSPILTVSGNLPTPSALATNASAAPPVESNSTVLNSEKTLEVTGPHDAVYRVKYSKQILTYAGKISEAEIKIGYNPSCEEAKFIRGVVTSKSGKQQEISKDEINVMDAEGSASAKRYTGGKVLVANLPGVDIGSTIDVEFEIVMKGKPYIGGFEQFQLYDNLEKKSFTLTAPASVKIEQRMADAGSLQAVTKTGDKGSQVFRWSVGQMKALPAETETPPAWTYAPGVSYFAGDFKAYLKDLNDALMSRAQKQPKAEAQAKQLAGQGKDPVATVMAIRDFVAKSIRLAGPSFTQLPLGELSAADTTLADGYGHSADRAIVLYAMLGAAGFHPEFVLASDLPPIGKIQAVATSFPLPGDFEMPLVKLTVAGTTYYLNDTDQYAKLGTTLHDDRLGVDLSTQAYETIAAAKDCGDQTETVYRMSLTDAGTLQMTIVKRIWGNEYNRLNRYFSELRPEERIRHYQDLVSGVAQGAKPAGDLITKFDAYPGTEQFAVEIDNYAVVDGKYLYFNLPFTPSLFQLPGGDRRMLPLLLMKDNDDRFRTEVKLPPGFQGVIIAPGDENLVAPDNGGTAKLSATSTPGKFVMTDELKADPAVVNPQDFPALLNLEATLEKKSAKVFLLEKK